MTRIIGWLFTHRETGPLIGLLSLGIVFQLASGGKFFTQPQLSAVAALSSSVGMVALGVTILMISGEFDLSVSQTFTFAPIAMAILVTEFEWSLSVAFVTAVAIVCMIGLINGLLTTLAGIPSFIATLGMLFIVQSVNRKLVGGTPVELFDESGWAAMLLGGEIRDTPLTAPLFWMLAAGGLLWFVLERTRHGNATRAVGHERGIVARSMGVSVLRTKLTNFVICAGLAGVAGCLQLTNFGASSVNAGRDYNLMAIVAAVIGGTSLFGVRGTIIGSIVGAILLGTLKSGLVLIGTKGEYYAGLIGVLLLAAAVVNQWAESVRDRGGR